MKYCRVILFFLFFVCYQTSTGQIKYVQKDKEILEHIFIKLSKQKSKTTAELVVLAGKSLLETPYRAHTLKTEPEQLIVNLRELDCTTYIENCLAIARLVKKGQLSFDEFTDELIQIRYRNSKINGYPSRLHYFSDWIYVNNKKGLVKCVSQEIANIPYPLQLNFMSSHSECYQAIKNNPEFIPTLQEQEMDISSREMYYLPKDKLPDFENQLNEGDIIGLTTSIKGLDMVHVGIVVKVKGSVHLMHASSSAEKVIISTNTLNEYLAGWKAVTGIMVARPL